MLESTWHLSGEMLLLESNSVFLNGRKFVMLGNKTKNEEWA